jgi:hypothetical protein
VKLKIMKLFTLGYFIEKNRQLSLSITLRLHSNFHIIDRHTYRGT